MVVLVLWRLNLGMPKLVCPKSVYRCRNQYTDVENSLYQPLDTYVNVTLNRCVTVIFLIVFKNYPWSDLQPSYSKWVKKKKLIIRFLHQTQNWPILDGISNSMRQHLFFIASMTGWKMAYHISRLSRALDTLRNWHSRILEYIF